MPPGRRPAGGPTRSVKLRGARRRLWGSWEYAKDFGDSAKNRLRDGAFGRRGLVAGRPVVFASHQLDPSVSASMS